MLKGLLGQTIACGCGRTHVVSTQRAVVGRGVLGELGPMAVDLGFEPGAVLVVADPDTFVAAGQVALAQLTQAALAPRHFLLPAHPVAGPETIQTVIEASQGYRALVAVGSGTINDIVKHAAFLTERPYLAVGTALSMNGYTSAIAAVLDGGIKRTVSSRPPVGVLIDLDICAAAPRAMTLAGLGDMLSKPFSEADWRLAHHLEGGYWCERPGGLLAETFDRMLRDAPGIGVADPEAMRSLAEAILRSGISMAMAGVSSPASGGEHLISHYWDMMCYARGDHPYALHGTQVGVACCLVDPLYQRVRALAGTGMPGGVEAALMGWPDTQAAAAELIRARHPILPDDVRERVVVEALQKWRPRAAQRARLERLSENFDEVLDSIGGSLLPPGAVAKALKEAGAPTTPKEIASELQGGLERWGLVRDMRARYTVLDLAAELKVPYEVTGVT